MYQEMEDTDWIKRNRNLNTTSWNNLSRDLNNVNVFDDATKQQLNAYNDSIYNRAKSDFDRDYSQTMNKYLARDYNRFGTTGGTSSLLTRDNYNLAKQRELADLEYQRALNYEDMINQELNRRYKWLDTNYNYFTNSGNEIQTNDLRNWNIRNQNLDRAYSNDVSDYNNSFGQKLGKVATAIGGTIGTMINPALGAGIYGLGNAVFHDADNLLGLKNNGSGDLMDYNTIFNLGAGLGGRYGTNFWNDDALRGDTISSDPYGILRFLSQYRGINGARGNFDNNGIKAV